MNKYLIAPLLALAISGCNQNDAQVNEIEEAFSFLKDSASLEYRVASNHLFLVKADNELYFYSNEGGKKFISPAPKAFDLNKNQYVSDLIANETYKFITIRNDKDLTDLRNAAKDVAQPTAKADGKQPRVGLALPLTPREEVETNTNTAQATAQEEKPNTHEVKQSISNDSATEGDVRKKSDQAVSDGEKRLADLKKMLNEKFKRARELHSDNMAGGPVPVTPTSQVRSSPTQPVTLPPRNLAKGSQFTYFNGTPVLKIDRTEDGGYATVEQKQENVRKIAAKIPMSWTINYPAIGTEKRQLFVFTDYTCPFCKKLHNDIQALNSEGITVRYLFYPRAYSAGAETPAAKLNMEMMRRAWCAPDQGEAITELFDTRNLDDYKCETVSEAKGRINFPGVYHHFLGSVFSVEGTPTYFTNDGLIDVGYQDINNFMSKKLDHEKSPH